MSTSQPIVTVALEPFGWHPAAYIDTGGDPATASAADHWVALAAAAADTGAAAAFLEDSFTLTARDRWSGRLDATLLAARLAPTVPGLGLVPSVTVTHTEPFHAAKAIATIDQVSGGRAGVQLVTASTAEAAELFGRKGPQSAASRWAEAVEYATVLRDLWDSWEDDAIIKDLPTGRFVDRDRLHYIDFVGEHFAVKGPSITPRPPQGHPVLVIRADSPEAVTAAARQADVVLLPLPGERRVEDAIAELRAAGLPPTVPILVDLDVYIADSTRTADRRLTKLDHQYPSAPDTAVFTGTVEHLRERIAGWTAAGAAGARLRPGVNAVDLPRLRGAFAAPSGSGTLRDRFGLPVPANRFRTLREAR